MKPATNISELANNLNPLAILTQTNSDMHVPVYENKILALKDRILFDDLEKQTFFVAGQSGSGKTTALNFLGDDYLGENYAIVYINCNIHLDLFDVNIIDLLLILAFGLVKDTPLEERYYKQLDRIQKLSLGTLTEEAVDQTTRNAQAGGSGEASAKLGFFDFASLKSRFFAKYQLEDLHRRKAREVFQLRKTDLLDLINDIIARYVKEVSNGKPLLLIIDDLDKIRDIAQINDLFIKNRAILTNILCKKVISVSAHLTSHAEISSLDPFVTNIGITLSRNPNGPGATPEEISERRDLLKQVAHARMAEGNGLIEDEVLEKAIDYSGGLLRQYLTLLQGAAMDARRKQQSVISSQNFDFSYGHRKNALERELIISPSRIRFLYKVLKGEQPSSEIEADTPDALLKNQIIAQENGMVWFAINPLIKEAVKKYGANQAKA